MNGGDDDGGWSNWFGKMQVYRGPDNTTHIKGKHGRGVAGAGELSSRNRVQHGMFPLCECVCV